MGIFDLIGIMKVLMVVNHTCMHVYGFLVSSEIKCFAKKVTSISSKKELGLEIGLIPVQLIHVSNSESLFRGLYLRV